MKTDILENMFKFYKESHPKCDSNFLILNKLDSLEIGDVFAIYGESIVNGLIIHVDEEAKIYEFIDLVSSPILGDFSIEIQVDSLFSNHLYITPLTFKLSDKQIKYCEKVYRLSESEMKNVLESFNKLKFYNFSGIRKKFLKYESERLEILEVWYLAEINKKIENHENCLYIESSILSDILNKNLNKSLQEELLVAAPTHIRKDRYMFIIESNKIEIILDDELVNKVAKIILFDEEIYSGQLPSYIELELPKDYVNISLAIVAENLRITLDQ
ncbi:MAG: hypothetical protein ABDH59_05380 [Fervidobacterium sp.]